MNQKTKITHSQLVKKMVALLRATNSLYIEMSTGELIGDKIRIERRERVRVNTGKSTKLVTKYKVISDSYGEVLMEPHQEYIIQDS